MTEHGRHEARPVFSFGQGCEGEPLTEIKTIARAVTLFRQGGGKGFSKADPSRFLEVMERVMRAVTAG